MKKRVLLLGNLILAAIFLISCSSKEANNGKAIEEDTDIQAAESKNNQELTDEDTDIKGGWKVALPLPLSFLESAEYDLTGVFAGKDFSSEAKMALDEFPAINKNASEEEILIYERYLFSLFKENLSMPNVPIDQWKAMKFDDPNAHGEAIHVKENYNVAILLDSSGSMGAQENGRTRMELAKEAIQHFVESLPEKANVSLSVYGHEGTGSESDKVISCSNVEQIYPLSSYESQKFKSSLNRIQPAGWTPMSKAIEQAMKDLEAYDSTKHTNIIYLVSDGIETCGGDPVQAMKKLGNSNLKPVVNIIGYQVDHKGLKQLKDMARAANGQFINVQNQEDLKSEFDRTAEMAEVWSKWHEDANSAMNNLFHTVQSQLNDWHSSEQQKMNREHRNLQAAVNYLNEHEKIDTDIFLKFDDRYRDYFLTIDQEARDLFLELDSMNRDSFLDNWDEIRDRFLENVNNK